MGIEEQTAKAIAAVEAHEERMRIAELEAALRFALRYVRLCAAEQLPCAVRPEVAIEKIEAVLNNDSGMPRVGGEGEREC